MVLIKKYKKFSKFIWDFLRGKFKWELECDKIKNLDSEKTFEADHQRLIIFGFLT